MNLSFLDDVQMSDPFLSLETDLDDISPYLNGSERMEFDGDPNWEQPGPSHTQNNGFDMINNEQQQHQQQQQPPPQQQRILNQHSPPQEFYNPEGSRGVSSLASLLNRPTDDYLRFSPPNFEMSNQPSSVTAIQPLTSNGPARMLSNLGPSFSQHEQKPMFSTDAYRPMSLREQLSSPALLPQQQQPQPQQPNGIFVNTLNDRVSAEMLSPTIMNQHPIETEQHVNGYLSPPYHHQPLQTTSGNVPRRNQFFNDESMQMMESPETSHDFSEAIEEEDLKPETKTAKYAGKRKNGKTSKASTSSSATTPTNTKEELLRMLMSMSPSDVERLKSRKQSTASCDNTPSGSQRSSSKNHLDEMDEIDEDDEIDQQQLLLQQQSQQMNSNGQVVPQKRERRTAHNLIEKKYRCSINDRIQHLKNYLGGEDAKLSKSATLKKAIEHISFIEALNKALRKENEALKKIIKDHGLQANFSLIDCAPDAIATDSRSLDSIESSPSPSPPPSKREHKKMTKDKHGSNGESSRVTLFAMLLAVLVFNPLGLLAGGALMQPAHGHGSKIPVASPFEHGRILDDNSGPLDNPSPWNSSMIRPLFVWLINIVVILCVLMRLLVYGEPVQDFKSKSWNTFVTTREKARGELAAGNLREAQRQFCECLVVLDRPLPSPGLESIVAVTWEIIRHFLNWLWIGRFMSRRRRSTSTPVSVVCKSHAHTAVLYHEIHQIHLMGITDDNDKDDISFISGLYLALSAVNLAESAGASSDGLPRSIMAQIYLAASIRCRLALPKLLAPIVSGYFFRRARRHVRRAPEHTISHLVWIFHPATRKFMTDADRLQHVLQFRHKLRLGSFVDDDLMSPLSRIRATMKVYLLSQLVTELAGGDEITHNKQSNIFLENDSRIDDEIDVVDISRLLVSISTQCTEILTNEKDESLKFGNWLARNGDACCTWWAHVLTCGIYWRSGKNEMARKHYSLIRNCPPQILKDSLGLSVGHALCARKVCIDDRASSNMNQFVCMHTKKALESLRVFSFSRNEGIVAGIQEGVRRMSYEWIMNSILDAWRINLHLSKPYWTQSFTGQQAFSTLYQEAYNHYSIIHQNRGDCWRIFVYELTSRMLNGANPQATWSGIRRVRSTKMDAVRGRVSMKRSAQPDAFHLHTLCKLHSSMEN